MRNANVMYRFTHLAEIAVVMRATEQVSRSLHGLLTRDLCEARANRSKAAREPWSRRNSELQQPGQAGRRELLQARRVSRQMDIVPAGTILT